MTGVAQAVLCVGHCWLALYTCRCDHVMPRILTRDIGAGSTFHIENLETGRISVFHHIVVPLAKIVGYKIVIAFARCSLVARIRLSHCILVGSRSGLECVSCLYCPTGQQSHEPHLAYTSFSCR